jgi:hypothetical protein
MTDTKEIPTQTVRDLKSKLISLGQGRWRLAILELQEEGAFLFIMIDVSSDIPRETVRSYLEMIKSEIEPRIPHTSDNFRWLVAASQDNEVVDSIF